MGLPRANSSLLHEGRRRPPLISHQQPNPASPSGFLWPLESLYYQTLLSLFPLRILSGWAFLRACFALKPFRALTPPLLAQSHPLPLFPHLHLCRGCPGCISSPDLSPKLQICLSSPAWHLRLCTVGNKTHCLPSNHTLYRP